MTKRWAGAGLLIVTVVAVAGVIFGVRVPVASAHARLVASEPTANAVLETAPVRILLDFDEDIETSLASIRLYDQRGAPHAVGEARQAGDASVIAADVSGLGTGAFVVVWRVASVDGHVVDGAFAFQVGTAQGVDTLVITGCTTSGCIRASAVDAVQNGFRPIVVRECVGDRHEDPHNANLFDIDAKYGDVISKAEAIDYLKSLP